MEEKVSTLMSLLGIDIVRFINIKDDQCCFVINGMLSSEAIECICEKYYMSIFVSAIEAGLAISLLEK